LKSRPLPIVETSVADRRVRPAGQVLEVRCGLAAYGGGLLRQDNAELREQAADAVDSGRALLDQALAHAVHAQPGLLVLALDRNEPHVRSLHCFADRSRVGCVVLAALAAHAIGRHELRRHQPKDVAVRGEQPRPVVRPRARLHADGARRQRGDQLVQLGPGHARPNEHCLAVLVDAVHRKDVLGEIDPNVENGHDFPFRVS
jgi:hypothetical protein